MTKNKAVDRMKNTNLMKKWTTMFFKKIVTLNNTQETMTEQHRYCRETNKKCLEKGRQYYDKKIKEDC